MIASFGPASLASDYATTRIVSFNESWVQVVAQTEDRFELVCTSISPTNVKVTVFNENGQRLHIEKGKQLSQFGRVFDFQNQPEGTYTFEIQVGETVHEKTIEIKRSAKLGLMVQPLEAEKKVWLQVLGAQDQEVWVSLTDRSGETWFSESVILSEAGERVFDLSLVQGNELNLTVSDGSRTASQLIRF
ncbi:MAG: hypothetical protein AAF399_08145 [Bacteroidota bacterium]